MAVSTVCWCVAQTEYKIRNLNCQIVQTKANRFTNNCNKIVLLILLAKQGGVHRIQAESHITPPEFAFEYI